MYQTDIEKRISRLEGLLATLKMVETVDMSTIATFENEIKELKADYQLYKNNRTLSMV